MSEPLAVLMIEDQEDDAHLVLRELRRAGYETVSERVETRSGLTSALREGDWDVVISDYSLPGFSGSEALDIVRAESGHLPFLIVSGAIGEETAVEMMRRGALDCIMKDKLSRLPHAVERAMGERRIRREKEEAIESLRRELRLNETLAKVSRNLIAIPGGIASIVRMVLDYAKELTDSAHGYVALIDAKTRDMLPLSLTEMRGKECVLHPDSASLIFPRGPDGTYPGLWGVSLNTRKPFLVNDPANHPASTGLPVGHIRIERFLSVPALSGEDLVGQVAVANPSRDYTSHDVNAIERLADLFSVALSNHRNLVERENLTAQLRQVQKMEALGSLAGGIAHDFNNILAPMIGYAELVKKCLPEKSKAWRHQEEVLKACMRAKELVEQILTLSRRTEAQRTPVLLQPIIREALHLLRSSIPSTIEIRQDLDKSCGPVLAVASQIHQVIMNLCTNAYHAMRERGGVLIVTMRQVHAEPAGLHPGEYILLEVIDTGHGMDPGIMERIFDPYFTTKEKDEGTGLGLSIVQSIVRKQEGLIEVESEPGHGTTFRVYLPVAEGEVRAFVEETTGALAASGEERIMIIDDVVEIVEMTKEMLESQGYGVTGFTSSTEALEEFLRDPQRYDLVITDLTMPNLTGVELARRLLAIRPDLPIILCSGLTESVSDETVKHLGIRKYLKKPILFHEYSQAVRQVLDKSKGLPPKPASS